jgi:hypothetical protein
MTTLDPGAVSADLAGLLDRYLAEAVPPEEARVRLQKIAVGDFPAGRALLALDSPRRVAAAAEALLRARVVPEARTPQYSFLNRRLAWRELVQKLLVGLRGIGEEDLLHLAEAAAALGSSLLWHAPVNTLFRVFDRHIAASGLSPRLRSALAGLELSHSADSKPAARLQALLSGEARQEPTAVEVQPGDAWADSLREALSVLAPAAAQAWQSLLLHCLKARAASASGPWLARARELTEAVGRESFTRCVIDILRRIGQPGSTPRSGPPDATLLDPEQTDLLRGLVWAAGAVSDADAPLAVALGDAALACFQKIPNHGPRNIKIGNACLQALRHAPGAAAAAQLSRLQLKHKTGAVRRQIDATLDHVARAAGLSAAELQEIAVPTGDLDEGGVWRIAVGEVTAELRFDSPLRAEERWVRADGTIQATVPAAVRAASPAGLAAVRRARKETLSLLAAQRDRLEELLLAGRSWDLATWRQRYLDQPLVGILARRLIWRFGEGSQARLAIAPEGRLVDVGGDSLDGLAPALPVQLWHPLESPAEEVLAWRQRLEEQEIRQPFKQAHREIYVLTDAERQTGTFSNRFAAHLVRQHPFAALCARRGWTYRLQGAFDGDNSPCRTLPEHGLQIQLDVAPVAEEQVAESGIFLYLSTGRVRLYDLTGAPRPLAGIPPRVFSELLRDVDLFVGVTSIGNDPNWADRREQGAWAEGYWQGYAWGELSAAGRTRRELLERLLGRLRIADRCRLTDRFLEVVGTLRTYRIHLGSGHVRMAPNDQHLCIQGNSSPGVFLPFEGDEVFALILSKAFLLADDAKITDRTIRAQIGR